MARSKLVCNLNMSDFFTLPDSGEIWRKKGGGKVQRDVGGKMMSGYECVSLYDSDEKRFLLGTERVDLVDK